MPRKKKKSTDSEFQYSKKESFENLETVQELALSRKGKDDEVNPDISVFLKAEELKGKLCGLYGDKNESQGSVNVMGSVMVDGVELKLNVGENQNTE